MVTHTQTREILEALLTLPSEKMAEVYGFVTFLQERYGHNAPLWMWARPGARKTCRT